MRDIDFINGFNDELMRNYEYSTNTRIKFIHYWLDLPNENTTFKISGNNFRIPPAHLIKGLTTI